MSDATPYDRRLVRKPYICLQSLEFRGVVMICEVKTKPSEPGPLVLCDLISQMQAEIHPTGKVVITDPGRLDQEMQNYIPQAGWGLIWQGDIPSSILSAPDKLTDYVMSKEGGVFSNTIGSLDDLTVNVSRHLLIGMAAQLEAALPALAAKRGGEDLGHEALIRAMISQAREIAGS